jgi:ABC-type nitrate/sulfonate/bicarbonate transport system substrate-binding protein
MDYFTAVKDHVDFTWIFYGWDGVSAKLKNEPINFIKLQDVDKNLDYYTPMIIANEDYLAKNPETAKKFLRAVTKGYQYAIENPEAAADLLLVDNPEIDRELAVASQKYLAAEYQSDAEKWGIMSPNIWENYGKWMYNQGLLENQLNANEAFTNEYLPQ